MKGIIIAAGLGSRLGGLTADTPKSLLPILGKPLIEYTMETMRSCGIDDISIVRGYQAHKFTYEDVRYYENADFRNNNILHSLMHARNEFDSDVVISYSDIWYSPAVLRKLVKTEGDMVVSVDTDWQKRYEGRTEHPWSEAEKTTLTPKKTVKKIGKHLPMEENPGEFIGLMKLSRSGAASFRKAFEELEKSLDPLAPFENAKEWRKAYLTDFLQHLVSGGQDVGTSLHEAGWLEMDTKQDYDSAGEIITSASDSNLRH